MQAAQTHSVVRQGTQVAIMSHLKPFSPAMACERHPLSKLPLEARAMIKAYCGPPVPTPTACIIKDAVLAKLDRVYTYPTLWRACFRGEPIGHNDGFMKYLLNNFAQSPGSVWTHAFTHRKLGHRLFCNILHGSWSCCAGIDSNGNKYPGFTDTVQI